MTLYEEIYSKCTQDQIQSRDVDLILSIVNQGRVGPNNRMIGNGTILAILGITEGNKLLDELNSNAMYRYVKPLIEQGRLILSSDLVQQSLQSMVPNIISQAGADKLTAAGLEPTPVSASEVHSALYNSDGSLK